MIDATNNGSIVLKKLGGGARRKYWSMLVNSYAERGKGKGLRFPYQLFEDAFLEFLGDLLAEDMVPRSADAKATTKHLGALQDRLANIDNRLVVFQKRLLTDDGFESLLTAIRTLETEKKELQAEVRQAKQETLQPASVDLLYEGQQLRKKLHTVTGDELLAVRLKVRAVIRSLVEVIQTRIIETSLEDGDARVIFAKIHFRNGPVKTIAAIHQRYSHKNRFIGMTTPKGKIVYSPFDGDDEKVDLRNLNRERVYQALVAAKERRAVCPS